MRKQDRIVEEKLKKSLLKNTLENSPFDMEVFALKQVEKSSTRDEKNLDRICGEKLKKSLFQKFS